MEASKGTRLSKSDLILEHQRTQKTAKTRQVSSLPGSLENQFANHEEIGIESQCQNQIQAL